MGCARSERPTRRLCRSDETRAPDERDPLKASVRRGWRESSKRSSASVRADAPFRGVAIARAGAGASAEAVVPRPGRARFEAGENARQGISGTSGSQQATVPAVCSMPPSPGRSACPVTGCRCPSRSDRLTPPDPGAAGCRPFQKPGTRARRRPLSRESGSAHVCRQSLIELATASRCVGFSAVLPISANEIALDGLFVEPERMRRSVGALLVADLATHARLAGGRLVPIAQPPTGRAALSMGTIVPVTDPSTTRAQVLVTRP